MGVHLENDSKPAKRKLPSEFDESDIPAFIWEARVSESLFVQNKFAKGSVSYSLIYVSDTHKTSDSVNPGHHLHASRISPKNFFLNAAR